MIQPLAELVQAASQPGSSGVRAAARLMSLLTDQPERIVELLQTVAALQLATAGGEDELAQQLADRLSPRLLLGVTGAPGAGKSTLTDALVREHRRRHPEQRVGVVAVDPTSPFSGGAVLGDRVRMMRHATDPQVFIRSLASRGHLGGLALGAKGVVRVMALIGCELVLVETVGVGQSEVEVAGLADRVAVVLAPGQGDSVQLLKAGLLEIADLLVVNKADRPDADRLHADLLASLSLLGGGPARCCSGEPSQERPRFEAHPGRRQPASVHRVCALDGRGVPELLDALEAAATSDAQRWGQRRRAALVEEVSEAVLAEARGRLLARLLQGNDPATDLEQVLRGEVTVKELAAMLLRRTGSTAE